MIDKITFTGVYSKRHRLSLASSSRSQEPLPSLKKHSNNLKLPKIKLGVKGSLINTLNLLNKNSSIILPIIDKAKEYEKAIKAHLGVKNISRDSSLSSLSPKIKRKFWGSPRCGFYSIDQQKLTNYEQQEMRIEEGMRAMKDDRKNIRKSVDSYKLDKVDEKDQEIQEVLESLNKINIQLKKRFNKK